MISGYLLRAFPAVALLSLLLYLPGYLLQKRRIGKRLFGRHLTVYAFIGYCLSIFYLTVLWYYPYLTFFPRHYAINLRPFIWLREVYSMGVRRMIEQLILNIMMFIPLGLLLPMLFSQMRKAWRTALAALLTTLMIETLQCFIGRSADIDDVITNFIGAIIGYLLFLFLQRRIGHKQGWRNAIGLSRQGE